MKYVVPEMKKAGGGSIINISSIAGIVALNYTNGYTVAKGAGAYYQQGTPLPRLGKPEDIAYGVLYLVSDESSFVTGTELIIDGGWTAR